MSNDMQVWVDRNKEKIFSLLPPQVSKERFVRNMVFQVANNPAIRGCDQRSIVEGCLKATLHGLDIGVLGSCYLVPFKGKAQLIIGYQGLLDLARRAGSLSSVNVECVREHDVYRRTATRFEHEWDPFADRGEIKGFYAILKLRDGGEQVETMSKEQVDSIRARSRAGGSGPWVTDYEEMGKKTVLRRALKKIKLSIEDGSLLQSDDEASFEHAEVVDKTEAPSAREKMMTALSMRSSEEDVTNFEEPPLVTVDEVDPDTGEVLPPLPEAPEEPGKPEGTSPERSRFSVAAEIARERITINKLNEKLGFPQWRTYTDTRRKLVDARMKAEGFTDREAFWRHVENVIGDIDPSYYEGWSSGANLETLIRVPSRRDVVDHFQRLSEGAATPKKKEDVHVNRTRPDEMSGALKDIWDEVVD